jgi:small subunit ribosomal protein S20
MANHKNSKKAFRQAIKRTEINASRMSRIRTFIKKVEALVAEKKHPEALEAFRSAQKELMRGVTKGLLHKNMAARKISRLSHFVKTIAPAQ